jgi:HSP20 family molecular chaperone IbpA
MAERDNLGGGFGLEGLLRGIGDLLHQAANMSSDRHRADPEGSKPVMQSRMSVRTVDGEEIGADFFGLRAFVDAVAERRQDEQAPAPPDRREPLIDIITSEDSISAIVELPGADPETLVVQVEHDMLILSASGAGIEYAAEALLPAAVTDSAREQSFRNGVLELKWPRAAAVA